MLRMLTSTASAFAVVFAGAIVFSPTYSYAENHSIIRPLNAEAVLKLENSTFHVYRPPFIVKRAYKNLSEVKNSTVEELMRSLISATTQDWVDFNYAPGMSPKISQSQFDVRKSRGVDDHYYEVMHRFDFLYNGTKTAILKYWFVENGARTDLGSAVLQQTSGRWVRTAVSGLEKIELVVTRLKTESLEKIFAVGGVNAETEWEIDLLEASHGRSGRVNFDQIYDYVFSLSRNGKYQTLEKFVDRASSKQRAPQ